MTIIFPTGWAKLKYPHIRSNLLLTLKELSEPNYQKSAWIDRTVDAQLANGICEAFHFFFDDTDLASNIDSCIGEVLLNQTEAAEIKPIVALLDEMLREIGDVDSDQYLRHPKWPSLVQKALHSFNFLGQEGIPTYTRS